MTLDLSNRNPESIFVKKKIKLKIKKSFDWEQDAEFKISVLTFN